MNKEIDSEHHDGHAIVIVTLPSVFETWEQR